MVVESDAIEIIGITDVKITTLGTIYFNIGDANVKFHVISPYLFLDVDGILGREYLRQEKVQISFWHNALVTYSNPINPIPFIDIESIKFNNEIEPEKKKQKAVILKSRSIND